MGNSGSAILKSLKGYRNIRSFSDATISDGIFGRGVLYGTSATGKVPFLTVRLHPAAYMKYREIGTVEECREAREKLPVAEEAIKKLLCSEYGSSCQFCIHDSDEEAVCCNIGGSGSWCCKNAKWNGRLE